MSCPNTYLCWGIPKHSHAHSLETDFLHGSQELFQLTFNLRTLTAVSHVLLTCQFEREIALRRSNLPELHQTTQENRFSYEVTIQCHSPVQSRRRKIQIFPVRRRRRSPGEKTLSIGRCARSGFSHGSVKKRLAKNSRRGKPISRLAHPGSWRHRHRDSQCSRSVATPVR